MKGKEKVVEGYVGQGIPLGKMIFGQRPEGRKRGCEPGDVWERVSRQKEQPVKRP